MTEEGFRRWRLSGPLFDDGYSLVPNAVLRDRRLSGLAKATWALLYDYSYRAEQPDLDELAADLGVGVKLARKALRELEDAGSVKRTRHGLGLPNSYTILEQRPFLNGPRGPSGEAAEADALFKDVKEDREVEADASTSPGGKVSTRPRNLVFDALATATSANPASDGSAIAKATAAIRKAMEDDLRELVHAYMAQYPEADEVPARIIDERIASEIARRAAEYARLRPELMLTPQALAKHWNRIPTWKPRAGSNRLTPAQIAKGER